MRNHKNNPKHSTFRAILRESFIVCTWVCFGAITIWGADRFGLLSPTQQIHNYPSLQVDFPTVYNIWKQQQAVFVDTRSTAHFKQGHIPGAINVPINRIIMHLKNLPTDKETPLITYCGSITCPNAYQLMNVLLGHGYQNVQFFPRGIQGWHAFGYPLETE